MVHFESIDHIDEFTDINCIWVNVNVCNMSDDMLNKILHNTGYCIPRDIPFGVCINYNHRSQTFDFVEDKSKCELYYIDEETGDKHWVDYELSQIEKYMIIDKCMQKI